MSTDATDRGSNGAEPGTPAPVAADRPVVDGTGKTSEQIRAEVAQLSQHQEEREHVEDLRADVGETVGELVDRLDVPARARASMDDTVAAVQVRRDQVTTAVTQGVDRARTAVAETAPAVSATVRERPGPVAAAVAAVLLLIVVVRRRRTHR